MGAGDQVTQPVPLGERRGTKSAHPPPPPRGRGPYHGVHVHERAGRTAGLSARVRREYDALVARVIDWTFDGTWPYEPKWFDSPDGRMHYVGEGPPEGRPVVMVHGNPT